MPACLLLCLTHDALPTMGGLGWPAVVSRLGRFGERLVTPAKGRLGVGRPRRRRQQRGDVPWQPIPEASLPPYLVWPPCAGHAGGAAGPCCGLLPGSAGVQASATGLAAGPCQELVRSVSPLAGRHFARPMVDERCLWWKIDQPARGTRYSQRPPKCIAFEAPCACSGMPDI